jgi:hypothetical protein
MTRSWRFVCLVIFLGSLVLAVAGPAPARASTLGADLDSCSTDTVIINTGYDQIANTTYTIGSADYYWTVTCDPDPTTTEPRPAWVILKNPAWQNPMPGSQWISSYPTAANDSNGFYCYSYCFCVKPGALPTNVYLCLRADDRADVYLNGNFIGSTPNPSFNTNNPTCFNITNPNFFVAGRNCLEIKVQNVYNVAMGLNVTGYVAGTGVALLKPQCCNPNGTIQGTKWNDVNGDCIHQSGEPVLSGWTINLSNGWTTTTDALGNYYFFNVPPGSYTVSETAQPGWSQTCPTSSTYSITVGVNQVVTNLNFGNKLCDHPRSDTCLAGTMDNFNGPEPASPSAALLAVLQNCSGGPAPIFDEPILKHCFGHTFSNCWDSTCLIVGAKLCVHLKAVAAGSTDDQLGLGDWPGVGLIGAISMNDLIGIATGGTDVSWDLGDTMTVCLDLANLPTTFSGPSNILSSIISGSFSVVIRDETEVDYVELIVNQCCKPQETGNICGVKFFDTDRDGFHDPGEPLLGNWTINLTGPVNATTTTSGNGQYCFNGLPSGTYTLTEVLKPNWIETAPPGGVYNVFLPPANTLNLDFGNWVCDSLKDTCCVRPPSGMLAWYPLDETAPAIGHDIAGAHNGSHIGTFTYGPGEVGGAYLFGPYYPNSNIVRVYNDPFVAVGTGDFTIDAWIKPVGFGVGCGPFNSNGFSPCGDPILDNRIWWNLYAGNNGVNFYVKDNGTGTQASLGLVMFSYPNQAIFQTPTAPIVLNQWQHIAVTVSRSGVPTGRFFVNGVQVGPTFTPIAGPLYTTVSPGPIMDIGHGTFLNTGGCFYVNREFNGWLDEIEIFKRALAPTDVSALYLAAYRGKCKDHATVPSVLGFCVNQTSKSMLLNICNESSTPAVYQFSLAGLASGSGCTVTGVGIGFTPPTGTTLTINPGNCVQIPIVVTRPAVLTTGNVACYRVTVNNLTTGNSFYCDGKIKGLNIWCPIIFNPHGTISLTKKQSAPVVFTVGNDNSPTGTMDYRIVARSSLDGSPSSVVRLNGLPPGEPVLGTLQIAPGSSSDITCTVLLDDYAPWEFDEIVLETDIGSGQPEAIDVWTIEQNVVPDCNGNGIDDAIDIANGVSLDANGNTIPDECERSSPSQSCPNCGDANGDAKVNVGDAVYLINYVFKQGPAPNPIGPADCNCDQKVNVGDAVYLINFVFKQGPAPCASCR